MTDNLILSVAKSRLPTAYTVSVNQFFISSIAAERTATLRGEVLRPGAVPSELIYAGDDAADTCHFGAFEGADLIGIASIYREKWPLDTSLRAFRLRGMAVEARFRGRGVGAALIRACLERVAAKGGAVLWCNARVSAQGFYESLGFETAGAEFEIEGVGAHFLMFSRV